MLSLRASQKQAGETSVIGGTTYICAYTAQTSAAKGAACVLDYDFGVALTNLNPNVVAVSASALPNARLVVARDTISAAGWYWWVFDGPCSALVDGTDITVGTTALLNTGTLGTAFGFDNATHKTARTSAIYTSNKAFVAWTTPVLKPIILLNREVQVDG